MNGGGPTEKEQLRAGHKLKKEEEKNVNYFIFWTVNFKTVNCERERVHFNLCVLKFELVLVKCEQHNVKMCTFIKKKQQHMQKIKMKGISED